MNRSLFLLCILVASYTQAKSVLVVSGGYQSCPKKGELLMLPHVPDVFQIMESAVPIRNAIADDPDSEILWSCYSGLQHDGSLAHIASKGTLEFRYGYYRGRKSSYNTIRFSVMDMRDGRILKSFFDLVARHIDREKSQRVYLVGHSYGGWTSLRLGVHLSQLGQRLTGIALLDPISPSQCPANVHFFGTAFFMKPLEGCSLAPRDITNAEMQLLADSTDWQINFYQTRYKQLHSAPLSYPGWKNQELIYLKRYWFGDTHSAMGTDQRVWHSLVPRVNGRN